MVKAHRDALRKLWTGICSVYVQESVTNETTGRSESVEAVALCDEPCRISYKSIPITSPNSGAAEVTQVVKLFIANGINIPEGSKIVVTQQGKTVAYAKSGKAAVYSCHQELSLELFKGWA